MKIDKGLLKKRELLVFGVILVIMIVMRFTTDTFLTWGNMMSVAIGLCSDGFIALAMTFILISGQIDLSVGAVQCLTSMIIGQYYIYKGMNIWVAALIAIAVSVLMGFITGSLIARLHIVPFIISLGMQGVARGLCYVISSGNSIPITGDNISFFRTLGSGYLGPVPIFFILLIITAIICQFLLAKTKFFAKVYFIGSNAKAADLAGIKVERVKITLYMISALLAAIAGLLSTARFGVSTPTLGLQAESRAITAAALTANPEINAIFCSLGIQAVGASQGCDQVGRSDITVFGFDRNPAQLELIKEGKVMGSIAQGCYNMGWWACLGLYVEANNLLVDHSFPTFISAGVSYIDQSNVDKEIEESNARIAKAAG